MYWYIREVIGMGTQKSNWHETRKARLDELFEGKKFHVVEEVNSDEPIATPLGYKVKSGYRLQSADGDTIVVGKALLNTLAEDYGAVDKPAPKKRGRPKKQPIELAEDWAARDLPADASPITQPGPPLENPNEDEHFEG
jgi:hypothetical protein